MAWTTAEVLQDIPDLEQYNEAVDLQVEKAQNEIDRLDEDIYFENMSESRVKRWEEYLELTPKTTDTLAERRFAIQSAVIDSLPYSYRVIYRELVALAGDDVMLSREWDGLGTALSVTVGVHSESMLEDIDRLLDKKLPLDVIYVIIVLYNRYVVVERFTHAELSQFTHGEIRRREDLGDFYVHNSAFARVAHGALGAYTHEQLHTDHNIGG